MKNFEMPKMNISIFSEENVVTVSGTAASVDAAKAILEADGVSSANITETTADGWITR